MSARLAVLPGLLAALALVPASAQAQRVSLSPTIGVYIPTSELVKAAEGEEFKQEAALSVGGRLGVTVSPRFGIETSVSYVPSNLRFTFDETQTTTDANLLLGTVRATFHAIPMTSPVWLTINGGASMIRRGGEAYEDVEDRNDVGGVVRRAGPGRGKALGASQDPKDPADVGAALAGGRAVLRGLRFTEGTAILEPSSGSLIGQIAGALARTPGQS